MALALAMAPVLWRRAAALARKRMEEIMPITQEERQAEIDAIHAEHAMAMRRLEMKIEAAKERSTQDMVESTRLREEIRLLKDQCAERDRNIAALQEEHENLTNLLSEGEAERAAISKTLAQTERTLKETQAEVEKLSRLYEVASLTGSALQVQLAAREADIERLNDTIKLTRHQRKEAERAMREAMSDRTRAEEALRMERERIPELERRIETLMTSLSTREEVLERQAKEIARLKQRINPNAASGAEEMDEAKARLEMKVADLSMQVSAFLEGGETPAKGRKQGRKSENERLRLRLAALTRENKKLRAELAAGGRLTTSNHDADTLRDRISDLAAEVVNAVALAEGLDSPIEKALAQATAKTCNGRNAPLSLAERVKALREGPAAAE